MNLAWILLLAQMSSPSLPKERMIVCWQNQSCINGEGEYVPPPTLPRLRSVACPPHQICKVKPPMDVPAVQVDYKMWVGDAYIPWKKWACSDQSRVLLTSENGKKHCIKFPEGQLQEEK